MIIVGAGMAGLLAAAMLRDPGTVIYEAQESLPHNHNSLLRFRSSVVGDTLGIPFKEVQVLKSVHSWRNPAADAMAYALKTTGQGRLRSILSAESKIETRYIAPDNLVERMAALVPSVQFGQSFMFKKELTQRTPVISTIPMPHLMAALNWPVRSEFRQRPGANIIADLDPELVDTYCSVYTPDPALPFARVSVTGSTMIAECYWHKDDPAPDLGEGTLNDAMAVLGLPTTAVMAWRYKRQNYAKILPIDERERKTFIMWASENHNVFSLGRFATWRPGLLLDDVVKDVRVIQRLIASKAELYHHRKKA